MLRDGVVGERVADVVELPRLVVRLRLLVGQRRHAARAPVDDAVPLVDEPLLEEPHERLAHRARQLRRERVPRARPVAARPDRLELVEDLPAGARDELLRGLDEPLAPEVVARAAVGGDEALDDVLRGDPGVVGAGEPECLVAGHAAPPREHVLHGVVQPVPHVQHRRDVGRRHHDHERVAVAAHRARALGARGVHARLLPARVDRGLGRGGVVGRRQLGAVRAGGGVRPVGRGGGRHSRQR
jgi:hypothetical protein